MSPYILCHHEQFEICVIAGMVPDGDEFRKKNGSTWYKACRTIRIFGKTKEEYQEIKAKDGVIFYTKENGDFNAMAETTQVVWRVSRDMLCHYMQGTPQ